MSLVFAAGFALYGLNMLVGLAAKLGGVRFGVWHHLLYAAVFASALAAVVWAFHPALIVTLAALATIPTMPARSPWHPVVASAGFSGYVLASLLPGS